MAAVAIALILGFGGRGGSAASCTVTGTTSTPGGTLTVCVRYGVSASGRLHLRSVLASFTSAGGYDEPSFTVTIADATTGALDDRVSGPADDANAIRSYRSVFTAFRGSFSGPATMVVTLTATSYGPSQPYKLPLASVALVLSRPAFPCPQPGTANTSIPAC